MAAMLATARRVLGYDLLELCLQGPKEKLDNTVYSQVGGGAVGRVGSLGWQERSTPPALSSQNL